MVRQGKSSIRKMVKDFRHIRNLLVFACFCFHATIVALLKKEEEEEENKEEEEEEKEEEEKK